MREAITDFREHIRSQAKPEESYWYDRRGQLSHLSLHNSSHLMADVLNGLTARQKYLSSKYFYDRRGSELFEQICELPEYYLTRAEMGLLEAHADHIVSKLGCENSCVELGSGSSQKTRQLFAAWSKRKETFHYVPVDISPSALAASIPELLAEFPGLWVSALHANYEDSFELLEERSEHLPISLVFLGSNIGNFTPEEREDFFRRVAAALTDGSTFAFGADLVKSPAVLEAAYNDSQGVTAEFNRNILQHLNYELAADFDVDRFKHAAFYNEREGRIEMHLESLMEQNVHINGYTISFERGETIHTENSYKFKVSDLESELNECGLRVVDVVLDEPNGFGFWITAP